MKLRRGFREFRSPHLVTGQTRLRRREAIDGRMRLPRLPALHDQAGGKRAESRRTR